MKVSTFIEPHLRSTCDHLKLDLLKNYGAHDQERDVVGKISRPVDCRAISRYSGRYIFFSIKISNWKKCIVRGDGTCPVSYGGRLVQVAPKKGDTRKAVCSFRSSISYDYPLRDQFIESKFHSFAHQICDFFSPIKNRIR